jgi:mRNA-degrading endonuclease RelE of RelBE toxin-antitoxin system
MLYIYLMNTTEECPALWTVKLTKKAQKQADKLPADIHDALFLLKGEMEIEGPVQWEWHHYGKLSGKKKDIYHSHLNKGHPRYVAVWEVVREQVRLIEIRYAGTHENVNYDRF